MVRLGRRLLLALLGSGLALSCLSPTLPLPPPSKPVIEGPDPMTGEVTLIGQVAYSRAVVIATNLALVECSPECDNVGAQRADEEGNFRVTLPAEIDDRILLYYEVGTDRSPAIEFVIPDPSR